MRRATILPAATPLLSSGAAASPPSTAVAAYATLGAAAVLHLSNNAFHAGMLKVKYGQPFGETWEEAVKPYLPSDALGALTAVLGVSALLAYGPVAAVVLIAGSVGGQALVLRSREHARRAGSFGRRSPPSSGRSPGPGPRSGPLWPRP